MRLLVVIALLVIVVFPTDIALAQNLPPSTTLTVVSLDSYSYRADDGTTVVLGEIQNNNEFPITNVKVGIQFLDQNDNTLEYKTGTTLLQVIPAQGKSPFSISSTKPDQSISKVTVSVAGFNSASTRDQLLQVQPDLLKVSDTLSLSGTIKNTGDQPSTNTKIYLISYDVFPRVVGIGTTTVSDIGPGKTVNFNITSISNPRAKSYVVLAESDDYQSKFTDVTNVLVSLPVVITNTTVTAPNGTQYSTIPMGAPVKISSDLKYISNNSQSYVYYVQVKEFGGKVAFIGHYDGVFLGSEDTPSVTWNPDTSGSYFIETYVWDSNGVPLSSAGTRINVVLVK